MWRSALDAHEQEHRAVLATKDKQLDATKAASARVLEAAEKLQTDTQALIEKNADMQRHVNDLESSNQRLEAQAAAAQQRCSKANRGTPHSAASHSESADVPAARVDSRIRVSAPTPAEPVASACSIARSASPGHLTPRQGRAQPSGGDHQGSSKGRRQSGLSGEAQPHAGNVQHAVLRVEVSGIGVHTSSESTCAREVDSPGTVTSKGRYKQDGSARKFFSLQVRDASTHCST